MMMRRFPQTLLGDHKQVHALAAAIDDRLGRARNALVSRERGAREAQVAVGKPPARAHAAVKEVDAVARGVPVVLGANASNNIKNGQRERERDT